MTLVLAAAGCRYDENDRCDDGQIFNPKAVACVRACPTNEQAVGDACQCNKGYERKDGACVAITTCTTDSDCAAALPHCAPGPLGGKGYCTKRDCVGNADCETGFTCTTWETGTKYCRRPTTGFLTSCAGQDDCAGQDANYCVGFGINKCVASGCSVAAGDCNVGMKCCASAIGTTLCIPEAQACQ